MMQDIMRGGRPPRPLLPNGANGCFSMVFAYNITGNIINADAVQATADTTRDTNGERYRVDEIG